MEKAHEANFLERHRPWKQKSDFEIEKYEQNRHEVVAHVKSHAGVLKRLETALIRSELVRVRASGREQPAGYEQNATNEVPRS